MIAASPHLPVRNSVGQVMRDVCLAMIPGILAMSFIFGYGVLVNLALAVMAAVACEAVVLRIRQRPVLAALSDGSAIVSGLLLGLCLPAFAPWWLPVFGAAFALLFGKHLYGGLGQNPLNPAMLGYVVLLISFPTPMTAWVLPLAERPDEALQLLAYIAGSLSPAELDALTGATPLDAVKSGLSQQLTATEAQQGVTAGLFAARGWEAINLAFAVGGLWLLARGRIRWQIPVGLLSGLAMMSILFLIIDADRYPGLLHHGLGGATMLGAFFIATDPVSASTTPRGRLIFGFGIGVLTWIIRSWGGYPDAIAFAVLLMNICVPLIDQFTPPRVYGHSR